jgi:hypothetical protein
MMLLSGRYDILSEKQYPTLLSESWVRLNHGADGFRTLGGDSDQRVRIRNQRQEDALAVE